MNYFLDTVETIEEGVGFDFYGPLHLSWLALFFFVVLICCKGYRIKDPKTKEKWRKIVAFLLVGDELWKMFWLAVGGNYIADYLPFHLCSINIILIAIHAWRPSKMLDNFLYLVCIPGALAALLFPSWATLPLMNFMHLHSFTVHSLLALYPIMLTVGGDIRPETRMFPKCLLLLLGMAIPIYGFNLLFDTNFMFLMFAEPGNPLYLFEEAFGNHLLGFPVIMAGVVFLMRVPVWIANKVKDRKLVIE